nr:olfactory receptor 48 [Tropidothorax elegans]
MAITVTHPLRKDSVVYLQITLLKLVSMWPIRAVTFFGKLSVHLYAYFTCITLVVSSVVLLLKAVKTTDLVDRSEAIDIFTLTLSAFFKLVFFIVNHNDFKLLVDFMDLQFPKRPLYGKESLTIYDWMKWGPLLTIIHSCLGFFCITFWGLTPILNVFLGSTSFSDMPLPMNVWYPFDYNHGFQYFALYLFHLFGLISSAHVYMACDGFLFSLVHFANGQVEILKASLRGIENVTTNGLISLEEAKHNAFKKCVHHHSKILFFLKQLDVLFRFLIAADVLHAIISLSFAMFQTSETRGILAQMKMFIFVGYCFVHQYLNSAFGQFLINQQESLMIEVYGVNWVDNSIPFRKSVHIMMGGGCINPVKLSAWRMYFLKYETFVEFVRSMVSFFMVLRTMQDQGMIN